MNITGEVPAKESGEGIMFPSGLTAPGRFTSVIKVGKGKG